MKALVSIGGYAFPEPSTYSATTSTFVDAGRNIDGYTIGAVIREGVCAIEMTWKYLPADKWAELLSRIGTSFYQSYTFFNQTTAKWETREFYVSDRTAGMWRRDPDNGDVMGWLGCKLSLVER